MHHTTAFGVVDLDTVAGDLARRLSSLRHFIDAAHELLTISHLSFSQFKEHSQQVCTSPACLNINHLIAWGFPPPDHHFDGGIIITQFPTLLTF
jgi:hypothetical protein